MQKRNSKAVREKKQIWLELKKKWCEFDRKKNSCGEFKRKNRSAIKKPAFRVEIIFIKLIIRK